MERPTFSLQGNCEYGSNVPPSIDSLDLPLADRTGDILLGTHLHAGDTRPIGFHAHDSKRPWCDLAVEKFVDRLATIEA